MLQISCRKWARGLEGQSKESILFCERVIRYARLNLCNLQMICPHVACISERVLTSYKSFKNPVLYAAKHVSSKKMPIMCSESVKIQFHSIVNNYKNTTCRKNSWCSHDTVGMDDKVPRQINYFPATNFHLSKSFSTVLLWLW